MTIKSSMDLSIEPDPSRFVTATLADGGGAPPVADNTRIYMPEIDGLRFLAFLLVFIHHSPGLILPGRLGGLMLRVRVFGWIGVDVFLVLSSFLIATLLLAEGRRYGTVSIRSFYIRRVLRIWPLYYSYLLLALFVLPPVFPPVPADVWWGTMQRQLPAFLLFLGNISYAYFYDVTLWSSYAHLWTVCLEEQFYLVCPIILHFFWNRLNWRFSLTLLFAMGISVLIRAYVVLNHVPYPAVWTMPLCRVDPFVMGLLLVVVLQTPVFQRPGRRGVRGFFVTGLVTALSWLCLPAAMYLFDLATSFPSLQENGVHAIWQLAAIDLACSLLIVSVLRVGLLKLLFGNPVTAWLGKISFGLYVYHELGLQLTRLLFAGELQTGGTPQQWVPFVSCALALTIAISALSYYTLERYFLRLKQRFEFVHSRPI